MAEVLRPTRGGYLRPFGAAVFIRDFLLGEGPKYGVARIDPRRGAPQSDIHFAYKAALHQAMAEDSAAWDAEDAIRRGQPLTPDQVEERSRFYLDRIPSKLTRMRYHSFLVYFGMLKRLGWVEPTGVEEPSEAQEAMTLEPGEPPRETGQPRIFYLISAKGRAATIADLSDPLWPLYHYPREKRSAKRKRLYYTPPRQRGRPPTAKVPPPPAPTPPPAAPRPVEIPAFKLPERPSRAAAQGLIKHLRRLDKMDPDTPQVQAEMERLEGDIERWVDLVEESLSREEEKSAPNEDRLARLQEQRDALVEAQQSLGNQDPESTIKALEEAFPRRGA